MSDVIADRKRSYSARGFWALIATQFQGAFNDNAYKWVIIFFLLNRIAPTMPESQIVAYATILFAVPFIIFPVYAGRLADRWSKRRVAIATKYFEVFVMAIGLVAFYLGSQPLVWVTLALMATQSAFFSPAKYGLLPETLPESRLSWANGILQMGTFVAIIAGTAVAGPLYDWLEGRAYIMSLPLIALSGAGILAAHGITPCPPANPSQSIPLNPWGGMGRYFKVFWEDRWLFLTMLGITYFFFAGAMIQQNILVLGEVELALDSKAKQSFLAATLALGIGLGSVLCGCLSRGKIEVGLIPLGALGMAISCAMLAWPGFGYRGDLILMAVLGMSAGFYVVPLSAVLQQRSPDEMKGGMIATNNFVTFIGVLLAGALYWGLGSLGLNAYHVFLIIAILTTVVGIYICWLLPVFLLRFVFWCLTNTIYRINVMGRSNVPDKGGALLVANHSSFIDALYILASIDRPVRFVMFQGLFDVRWIRPLARIMGAIPISATAPPRELLKSLQAATDAIKNGEIVCLFPEGQITRTGQMNPFKKGYERIMKDLDAPIIPVYMDRLWGSVFSFEQGRFFWKTPHKIPYPITINYGEPFKEIPTPHVLRAKIRELGSETMMERDYTLLHRPYIRIARKHPSALALADGQTPRVSYFKSLVGSIVFARKFKKLLGPEEMTAVLIPTCVGAALTNIALSVMGKVSVNLNYTASADARASAVRQCGIKHVITARAFLEKLPMDVPGEVIYLEDVKASVTVVDRLIAVVLASLCPVPLLERIVGSSAKRSPEDLATVVFSSGSEGEPKGVMLSHRNVHSNVDAVFQVFPNDRSDGFMGMLPFFHSFGYMATLWLPLTRGLSAVYHPNPMEPRIIGELIRRYKSTFFIATSTFLQPFIRRCAPEQLSSLKYIICGAEKLAPRVREAFRDKFGVEPLEGYGTTECSPAVALNVPDFRSPGFYQKGTKHGTVGHPLPGISVRTVDPDTGEVMPEGGSGVLEVKGPNIMKGYLNMPEKTASVLKDGWYNTGDIASIDDEGFITLTDRLSRFSKIGGEMVPHVVIEEALHELLGLTDRALAVTAVQDEGKGERLIVLHTLSDEQLDTVLATKSQMGLPNLWLPKSSAFHTIDEIPVLATGKMDLRAVKELARKIDIGE